MRFFLVAAALVCGLASHAVAQSRTLPAGSERAAQPPIDWPREAEVPMRVDEGRSVVVGPLMVVPRADRSGNVD